jgi:hypothetical protein
MQWVTKSNASALGRWLALTGRIVVVTRRWRVGGAASSRSVAGQRTSDLRLLVPEGSLGLAAPTGGACPTG